MKKLLFITVAALSLLVPERPQAQAQAPASRPIAIRGGTVLTVTRGTIQNGIVVLRNGRIEAVGGPETALPPNAEIVDASGRFVSPGIIDAHSHIAADSINEGGTTVSSMTGIEDVLDPTDINIFRDLAGGLTVANVLHGSANPIGGKNAVIKLRWGKTRPNELLFEGALPGIKFALGENPKDMRPGGGAQQDQPPRRYPVTRPGVEFVIRDAFTRAKAYQREWQEYEKRRTQGAAGALPPRRDLQLEPLVEILEGKRLVHAHCYRADEILMLIRLAEEMGFKIATFQHVLEGFKVADEIAAHGAGASTFSDWWAYKVEAEDAIPYNAALMHKRGVVVSINSDSAEHSRRLNTEAAKAIHWGGLSEDEALSLVTINPAKQLRIDNRVGSLEAGKDADVVIWNNHPLSTYAIADRVYIDGVTYYDRREDEKRLTEARSEKSRLAAAEERTSPTPEEAPRPRPQASGQSARSPEPEQAPGRRTEAADRAGVSRQAADQGLGGVDDARVPQPAPAGTGVQATAITNARIHPITQPTIERGTILMRGGRIEAVGAEVQVPAGTQVIDAKGADVYPGFVDGRTSIGLNEPGPRGFEDVQEMHDINAGLRAYVAYQADSDAIAVARTNGVTTIGVMPAGGLLGGQAAVMNLDGWTWEEATLQPTIGVTFQFPAIGGGGGFGGGGGGGGGAAQPRRYEDLARERNLRVKAVEDIVNRAKGYAKIPAADRRIDWNLEALVPIVERRQPLFVQASTEEAIREAVAFADRVGVRIVITGGLEAPLVAPLLAEKNVPVLLGSVLTLPSREDLHHAATYKAAGELAEAGVKFGLATGSYQNVRLLPYEAAISIAWGLPRDKALRAITIDTADILGVASQVGSIEPGKLANVVIWQGDPLDLRTPVPRVFIAGRDVGPHSKHFDLYERFSNRPPTAARAR
jgi:imidazolonepropionase-like amidohydrolase